MVPPWTGVKGPHLGVEIPPLWRVSGGSSQWSSLSFDPSWGTGLTSNFGRTTDWGRGGWLAPSLVSTSLPRPRRPQSGLHGLATGPWRYHWHSLTNDWLISWACSPNRQTLGLKRRPGMRGSGGNPASRPRQHIAYSVGRPPPLTLPALPRPWRPQSGLHGLATGPWRYRWHSRTNDWLISWACSPNWRTLGLKRRPGMHGSGGNPASRPRQHIAYSVGRPAPEDPRIIQRCRLVWKRRIPLKIHIFGWLLLRQRLMTRVVRQRMLPASSVSCPLCDGALRTAPISSFYARWLRRHGGWPRWPVSPWHPRRHSGYPNRGVSSGGRRIGGGFSPLCGQSGSTGTRLFSGESPRPMMSLYTLPRGFIFPGTEAAHAPRTMNPYYDRPRCLFSLTQWKLGAPFGVLPSLLSKKKNTTES